MLSIIGTDVPQSRHKEGIHAGEDHFADGGVAQAVEHHVIRQAGTLARLDEAVFQVSLVQRRPSSRSSIGAPGSLPWPASRRTRRPSLTGRWCGCRSCQSGSACWRSGRSRAHPAGEFAGARTDQQCRRRQKPQVRRAGFQQRPSLIGTEEGIRAPCADLREGGNGAPGGVRQDDSTEGAIQCRLEAGQIAVGQIPGAAQFVGIVVRVDLIRQPAFDVLRLQLVDLDASERLPADQPGEPAAGIGGRRLAPLAGPGSAST